jgi:hypothetical protein
MPNEFVIKNGYISKGNSIVEGGLTATTISATTYSNLPSSPITVGTTQITSGTDGRVLFQSGTTLQQDSNFTYDTTLKRLTLRAVGVTSSDIPFVIQSSGGTFNLMDIVGTGDINFRTSNTGATGIINMSKDGNGAPTMYLGSPAFGYKWHNFYTAYVFSPLDGNNGYEGRIDLGRYNGAVRTRFVCAGDSFLQYSNLVLGDTTAGARLDVRAQGALSTDIAFRVRNSANSANLVSVTGEGVLNLANLGDTSRIAINATTLGQLAIAIGSGQSGLRTTCVGFGNTANGQNGNIFGYGNNGVSLGACGTIFGSSNTHTIGIVVGSSNSGSGSVIVGSNNAIGGSGPTNNAMFVFGAGMTETSGDALLPGTFMFGSYTTTGNKAGLTFKSRDKNHLLLGYDIMNATYSSQNGTNWLGVKSGTAPDGAIDAFQLYSADITTGNAAPHFRTENGSIVKLYQETTGVTTSTLISNAGTTITDTDTFDGYTLQQIVKALRNLGVLQ